MQFGDPQGEPAHTKPCANTRIAWAEPGLSRSAYHIYAPSFGDDTPHNTPTLAGRANSYRHATHEHRYTHAP